MKNLYTYKVRIVRILDGDTVDVDIDLGFGIWMAGERIRIFGIDTPEVRTRDNIEKTFGFAAKDRVEDLLEENAILVSIEYERGKFGRILGDFILEDGRKLSTVLLEEGHALPYGSQANEISQQERSDLQEENRKKLIENGKVVLPPTPE